MANGVHHAHSLAVDKFRYEQDDFGNWVTMFEDAVGLAHGITAGNERDVLCLRWLPLKLDESARMVYKEAKKDEWATLKTDLTKLLIDPQDKYNWLSGRRMIVWDGKESFHSLASRVKASVDKYDDDGPKEREYFLKFRQALPPEYRKAIDIGCGDTWSIDNAKKIANRLRLADGDVAAGGAASADRTVAFTGASMSDDCLKTMEMSLQGIAVRMENLDTEVKKILEDRESQSRGGSSSRECYDQRSQSRGRDGRDRENRYSRDSSRDGGYHRGGHREDRHRAYEDHRYSGERSHQERDKNRWRYENRDDSRDRRDDWGRWDSRERQASLDRNRDGDCNRRNDRHDDRGAQQVPRERGWPGGYHAAEFDAQMEHLAAALNEKQLRDSQ